MTTARLAREMLGSLAGVSGIPVLPMISFLYYFYYALPILRPDSGIAVYTASEVLDASITVTLFLMAAAIAWQAVLATRNRRHEFARADIVTPSQLTNIIFCGLGLGLVYFVALFSGYLNALG